MNSDVFPSKNTLRMVHDHLLLPATYACCDMEANGFKVSTSKLLELETRYHDKLVEFVDRIRSFPEIKRVEKRIGKQFNVNSPDQVRDAIFNEFGLSSDGIELTKKGQITGNSKLMSTGKETFAKLKGSHEIIDLLKQQRKYSTLDKMFVRTIRPKYLCPDSRVHIPPKIHGTVTGRLSMSLLHQIPKNLDPDELGFDFDTELNIKHLFVPTDDNYGILQADYGQMELRVLAEYARDEAMLEIFRTGQDIHIATGAKMAAIVYGNKPQYNQATGEFEVCNKQGIMEIIGKKSKWRKAAKAINFGIIYGKGDDSLAEDLGCTVEEAKKFKVHYFAAFPQVKEFIEFVHAYVKEHKQVDTMFGNIRRLLSISSPQTGTRNEALRQSVNAPVQGTSGHVTLCALININDILKKYKMRSKIVTTVHDSLVLDVYNKELDLVKSIVQTVMVNPVNRLIYWDWAVNLEVDIEYSNVSWAEVK